MAFAITTTPLYDANTGVGGQSLALGWPAAKKAYGKHRIVEVEYAIPSAALPAAGDIVRLTKLKDRARVIAGLSAIVCDDPGTTLTVNVGDWANPKRYTAGSVLSAASSTVGGGAIGFGLTPGVGKELFVPIDIRALAINPVYAAPAAWVTNTTYNIGDRVTSSSITYVCLIKHVAGTFATDLTNLKWVISGSYQPWITSNSYTIGDAVITGGGYYVCIVAHTSGTFATDLASADWVAVTPDETEVIMQCVSSSTLTTGVKILILLAVVDE
jgi:hypothetical protein